MSLFSKFKLLTMGAILVISTNVFSYRIDCLPEKGMIHRANDNLRRLKFHNGGGIWTGVSSTYLTFRLGSSGNLYDFDYQEDVVDFREISGGHYQAEIKVSKIYTDEVIVSCDIRE